MFAESLNLKLQTAHAHDGLNQGEDDKPDKQSHDNDNGRFKKRQLPLDAGFKSFVKDLINFKKYFLLTAGMRKKRANWETARS
jgi:hypothetical protein